MDLEERGGTVVSMDMEERGGSEYGHGNERRY
jgi:hypothetical protein